MTESRAKYPYSTLAEIDAQARAEAAQERRDNRLEMRRKRRKPS